MLELEASVTHLRHCRRCGRPFAVCCSWEPRLRNPKLHSLYKEVDHLSDDDQQALVDLLDSLVKRSQMNRLLSH